MVVVLQPSVVYSVSNQDRTISVTSTSGNVVLGVNLTNWAASLVSTIVSNPTPPTTSTTNSMLGIGSTWKLTPKASGIVEIEIDGSIYASGANTETLQIAYGTGGAPANNAAATGTAVGNPTVSNSTANVPFSMTRIISGLTPGTAYWFDLQAVGTNVGATPTMTNITVSAKELMY